MTDGSDNSIGDRIEQGTRRGAKWLSRLGGAIIALIALLVCGDVIARNVFNSTVFHSFEISLYLFAVAVSFGFAQTLIEQANIRIDVVYNLARPTLRRALDQLALLSVSGLAVLFTVRGWQVAFHSAERGKMSNSSLAVPLAIPQTIWAMGLTVFALVAMFITVRHALALALWRGARADALGAISGGQDPYEIEQATRLARVADEKGPGE
jgi:TRAP-type C4-dicarboxylate transport system permease small subunit